MASTQLSAALDERLEIARTIAMMRAPYWSVEIAALVWVECPLDTVNGAPFYMAVTSEWIAIAHPRIVAEWTPGETATVIIHEMLHLWQGHAQRARMLGIGPEDHRTWNIAADLEINQWLEEAKWPLPAKAPGVFPKQFGLPDGLLAEEYFEKLLANPRKKNGKGGGNGAGDGDPIVGQGNCGSAAGNEHDIEKLLDLPEGAKRPEQEQEEVRARMSMSAENAASKQQGTVPNGMKLAASRALRKSRIDWRQHLRAVVRSAVATWVRGEEQANWKRFGRRALDARIPRPSFRNPVPRVMIALDTSGSMWGLLDKMFPEVEAVLTAARAEIELCQCDAAIAELRPLRSVKELEASGLKGGGGTSFRPVFTAIEKRPVNKRPGILIYITDGYGDAPENPPLGMKVVWAMLGGTQAPASWGTAVLIEPPGAS